MRPLRWSINVTLDGCVDHRSALADEELHERAATGIARADVLLFGRVTYQMMEEAFRDPDGTDVFATTIDAKPKLVVSRTLTDVDWNAELVRGDLGDAVRALKDQPGDGIALGGVQLPLALAELGLIDEYELVVHPRVWGHGPRLLDGLSAPLDLREVDRVAYDSGAVATTYVPR